jgi:hypothetical protein
LQLAQRQPAAVNHINYQLGPRDIVTFRTDYMDDAYDNPAATPGGGKHSQTLIAADAIFHF